MGKSVGDWILPIAAVGLGAAGLGALGPAAAAGAAGGAAGGGSIGSALSAAGATAGTGITSGVVGSTASALTPLETGAAINQYMAGNGIPQAIGGSSLFNPGGANAGMLANAGDVLGLFRSGAGFSQLAEKFGPDMAMNMMQQQQQKENPPPNYASAIPSPTGRTYAQRPARAYETMRQIYG